MFSIFLVSLLVGRAITWWFFPELRSQGFTPGLLWLVIPIWSLGIIGALLWLVGCIRSKAV